MPVNRTAVKVGMPPYWDQTDIEMKTGERENQREIEREKEGRRERERKGRVASTTSRWLQRPLESRRGLQDSTAPRQRRKERNREGVGEEWKEGMAMGRPPKGR